MLLNCGVGEDSFESPLDCREIQPVHPKGDQSWVFIGRTDVEAETPIFCPPDVKSWLTGKDPAAGKDWRQEEKGMTQDKIVGWHHRLNGHGFGWTLGAGDGREAWRAAIHRVAKSQTWLSDWTELNWPPPTRSVSKPIPLVWKPKNVSRHCPVFPGDNLDENHCSDFL